MIKMIKMNPRVISIDQDKLFSFLQTKMSEKDFHETVKYVDQNKVDAIPFDYIRAYANGHDAVCYVNMVNLVDRYLMGEEEE